VRKDGNYPAYAGRVRGRLVPMPPDGDTLLRSVAGISDVV